jgi:hypothetical protein
MRVVTVDDGLSWCVWKLPDCKNVSLCLESVEAGRAPVFGDSLTARM